MKNKKTARVITLVLSCLLLVGVALGITVSAANSTGATSVEIAYKNVSYSGSPRLVVYTDTDKALSENQRIEVLIWDTAPESGVYNKSTADYAKSSDSTVIIEGKQHEAFLTNGVAPSDLRKTVYIRPIIVETAENGEESVTVLGEVLEYSIFDYAVDMFAAKGGAQEGEIAMYSYLLDYAASIQKVLFANEDGTVNEEKLEAAGGWANAYYIAQVERYIEKSETGECVSTGETYREYSQTPSLTLEAEMYYESDDVTYMFKGFKNLDDSTAAGENLIDDDKTNVTATPVGARKITTGIPGIGVAFYKEVYGEAVGAFTTYDEEGKQSADSFSDATNFWAQYYVNDGNVPMGADNVPETKIKTFYFIYEDDKGVQQAPVEVIYFYTADGTVSSDSSAYRYICVDTTKTGKDMLVQISGHNKDGLGSIGKYLAENPDSDGNLKFYSIDDEKNFGVDFGGYSLSVKKMTVPQSGYIDYVSNPANAKDAANKVLEITKHIYDKSATEEEIENNTATIVNEAHVNGYYNSSTPANSNGSMKNVGQFSGTTTTNLISGITVGINNQSPVTYYNGGDYVTHVFETDFYMDGYTAGTLTQFYLYNTSGQVLWQMNMCSSGLGEDGLWLGIENGPGNGELSKIHAANGSSPTQEVIAGTYKGVTVGKSLYQRTWYNLRIEYVAEENNKCTIMIYIDGELCSYIRDDVHSTTSNSVTTYYEDDYCKNVNFFHLNASRNTHLYLDNTYLASIGDTEKEFKPYDDGKEAYWGQGKYYDQAQKFPEGTPTGHKTHTIEKELDADGNELDNTVLHMLKTSSSGTTTNFLTQEKNGNIYVFETDVKVVGSDSSTWINKMQFIADSAGGDVNEFAMICFMFQEGDDGYYWTLSQQDAKITDENGNIFKGSPDKWYNLRFEYNPIDSTADFYINNEFFTTAEISQSGSIKDNSVFAGIGFNIRARGGVYTDIIIDNTIATTIYTDSLAEGTSYDKSESYDGYTVEDGNTGIKVKNENGNSYLDVTSGTLTGEPANKLGHAYVYETDIKWNGISFGRDSASADVLSLKLMCGDNAILDIVGSADAKSEPLLLKVKTDTVATLSLGYWVNLRVVYTPKDPVDVENEDKTVTTVYSGTVEVYINNGLAWSGAADDVLNTAFDKATLTVNDVAANILLDNTYVGTYYVDDLGNGENASDSDTFEEDETAGRNQYITNAVGLDLNKNYKIKFNWNGTLDGATAAELLFLDKNGNYAEDKIKYCIANSEDGYIALDEAVLELDKWYNIKLTNDYYIVISDGVNTYELSMGCEAAGGVSIVPLADTAVNVELVPETVDKSSALTGKQTIASTVKYGSTYVFETLLSWKTSGSEGFDDSAPTVMKLEMLDADEKSFYTIYGIVTDGENGEVLVLSLTQSADDAVENVALDSGKTYTLRVKAENGKYSIVLDGEEIYTDTVTKIGTSFGGARITPTNSTVTINVNKSYAEAYNGYASDVITIPTSGSESGYAGTSYSFAADINISYSGTPTSPVMKLEWVDARGNVFFSIYGIATSGGAVKLSTKEDGSDVFATIAANKLYALSVSSSDGLYTITVTEKSNTKNKVTVKYELALSDTFAGVEVSVPSGVILVLQNAYSSLKNEYNRIDGAITDTDTQVNAESVGTGYTYETDIRVNWNGVLASGVTSAKIFTIELVDSSSEAFFTIYGLVSSAEPGYVTLSLSENADDGFYSIPLGIWYNVNVTLAEGKYSVTLEDKVRVTGDIELPADFVGAVITVSEETVLDIDNTYLNSTNDDFKGKGENKDNAIGNLTSPSGSIEIEYDEALGEADPDNEFTDAYIEAAKSQITMGKQTATSNNSLTFLDTKSKDAEIYVFETDIHWAGSKWGTVSGGNSYFHKISLLTKDAEGEYVELAAVYAVGVYYLDTVATETQYVKLYTSLEDAEDDDNAIAIMRADLWYNLRIEYTAASGDYSVFLNNESIADVDGAVIENVSFAGAKVELGTEVYDTVIKLQNIYMASVTPETEEEAN